MKKLIFAILCLLSTNAYCAWYNIANLGNVKGYINIESIRKTGDLSEAWFLYDLKKPVTNDNNQKIKSIIRLEVFDCVNRRNAKLQTTYYPGSMGKGTAWSSDNPSNPQWENVIPGSNRDNAMLIVCAYTE